MHTFTCSRGYTFLFSDGSGMAEVAYKNWGRSPVKSVHLPCSSVMEFAAELVRREKIARLEQQIGLADAKALLGL